MSALTIRLIEAQAGKLKRESRILRHRADTESNERIAMLLRRRAWQLTGHAVKIMQEIGNL